MFTKKMTKIVGTTSSSITETATAVATDRLLASYSGDISEIIDQAKKLMSIYSAAGISIGSAAEKFCSKSKDALEDALFSLLQILHSRASIITIVIELLRLFNSHIKSIKESIYSIINNYIQPLFKHFQERLNESMPSEGRNGSTNLGEQHSYSSEDPIWASLGPLAVGIAAVIGCVLLGRKEILQIAKGKVDLKMAGNIGRDLSNLQRGIRTAWDFVRYIFDALKEFIEAINLTKFSNGVAANGVNGKYNFKELIMQMRYYGDETNFNDIIHNDDSWITLQDILRDIGKVEQAVADKKLEFTPTLGALWRDALHKFREFKVKYLSYREEREDRKTPFAIQFFGKPGTGKSTMTRSFIHDLKRHTTGIFDEGSIYTRAQTKHWDGYHNDEIIVMDDAFQDKGSTPQESSMLEYIHLISTSVLRLPMADLADKGTTFKGKLIVTNTNNPFPQPTELAEYKALYRRRNFLIEVQKRQDTTKPFTDHNSRLFIRHDPLDERRPPIKTYSCYEEMVAEITESMQQWNESANEFQAMMGGDEDLISAYKQGRDPCQNLSSEGETNGQEQTGEKHGFFSIWGNPEAGGANAEDLDALIVANDMATNTEYVKSMDYKTATILLAIATLAGAAIGLLATRKYNEKRRETTETREVQEVRDILDSDLPPEAQHDRIRSIFTGEQRSVSGDHKTQHKSRNRHVRIRSEINAGEKHGADGINSIIENNIVTLGTYLSDHSYDFSGNGVGLFDRWLLVPQHLFNKIPALCTMVRNFKEVKEVDFVFDVTKVKKIFFTNEGYRNEQLGDAKFRDKVEYDMCLIELPKHIPPFRDIRSHFQTENEMFSSMSCTKSFLISKRFGKIREIRTNCRSNLFDYEDGSPVVYTRSNDAETQIIRYYAFDSCSVKGDSGSPHMAVRNGVEKVIGILVGGGKSSSWSEPFCREMFDDILKHHTGDYQCTAQLDVTTYIKQEDEPLPIFEPGDIKFIGNVHKQLAMRIPVKTDIIPSPIAGWMPEPKTGPAAMSLHDSRVDPDIKVTPMQRGIMKFDSASDIPYGFLADAVDDVSMHIDELSNPSRERRLLTDYEMINGTSDLLVSRMNMETSPGLPYKYLRPFGEKGKEFLFDRHENPGEPDSFTIKTSALKTSIAPPLRNKLLELGFIGDEIRCPGGYLTHQLVALENSLLIGNAVEEIVAYENLKQERVSVEKIKIGKTRTFDCLPVDFNLLTRKYFGAWCGAMQHNRVDHPISIGINPTSEEWTHLYRRLVKRGKNRIIAGDYSGWDGSVTRSMMEAAIEVINQWYNDSDENQTIRQNIGEVLIDTQLLVGYSIFQKRKGMPSGCAITTELNSLMNWILLVSCFKALEPKLEYRDHLELAVYGDDHIVSVSKAAQKFNFQSLKVILESFGMKYTDSRKRKGVEFDFQNISEISYLKRSFVETQNGYILAPLEDVVLTEMVMWVRECDNEAEALSQVLESFRGEITQVNKEFYDSITKQVSRAIEKATEYGIDGMDQVNRKFFTLEKARRHWFEQHGISL